MYGDFGMIDYGPVGPLWTRIYAEPDFVTLNDAVGKNMKWLREREGASQTELAEVLTYITDTKWDQSLVSEAENGKRRFNLQDLFAIAAVFKVSVIRLFDSDQPMRIGPYLILDPGEIYRFVAQPRPDQNNPSLKDWPPPLGDWQRRLQDLTPMFKEDPNGDD